MAAAGACVLHVAREACNKAAEAESFGKCQGVKECDESPVKKVSAVSCAKHAEGSCSNGRLTVTKSKKITATFNGVPVEGGKNFCKHDRPDFNKC